MFSTGISARRAPFPVPIFSDSTSKRIDLMLPWMLRSPGINSPVRTDALFMAELMATTKATPHSHGCVLIVIISVIKDGVLAVVL